MPPVRTRRKRFLGRLLLTFVPLALAFGAGELILRVAAPGPPAGEDAPGEDSPWLAVRPSAELGWTFPPDTTGIFKSSGYRTQVTTNAWGLRGPAVSPDTLTRRVLFLGDSYTFGWRVADNAGFVRLLEERLRREFPESPVECINGGLPGYSIYQQIRLLAFVRQRTTIDAVVATISLANDPIDEKRIRRFAPDRLAEFSYDLRDPASRTARLIASSRLLTLVDQRTTNLQFSILNHSGECRRLADESLENLAAACRAADLPLVWVIVPRAQEIRPGGFWKRGLNRGTDRLRRHFLALAADLGVPAVDLKPALLAARSREEVYLPSDAHWNEVGHRAVDQVLWPPLREAWERTDRSR
jgi:lysophospholipase L1-like esterase